MYWVSGLEDDEARVKSEGNRRFIYLLPRSKA